MTIWQVTWNPKKYDYKRVISDYRAGNHTGFNKQSKGMAKMKNLPKIDDIVHISCNKQKIMTCTVVSEFVVNEQEMHDGYNIGVSRPHTANNTLLMLKILEIYDEPERMNGFQRTWVKLSV